MIKAIETVYNGYRFRSRLEARWAVFFDRLGVQYVYEHQGYDLGHGVWYLPDFYMPTWDKYVEIKPFVKVERKEFRKCVALAQRAEKAVLLVRGNPWPGEYVVMPFLPAYTSSDQKVKCAIAPGDWNCSCFAFGEETQQVYLVLTSIEKLEKGESPPLQNLVPLEKEWYAYNGISAFVIRKEDLDGPLPILGDVEAAGIHAIIGHVYDLREDIFTLSHAYVSARQARFEHGETPRGTR